MIIARKKIKIFTTPSPMPTPFPIPTAWLGYPSEISVEYSKRCLEEFPSFTKDERKLIKNYKNDLKNNYIYRDHPSRPNGKTEYLAKDSRPNSKFNPYHRLTKRINLFDRFDYLVYPPELQELDDGSFKVVIPITIQSLKDHNIAGQRLYSLVRKLKSGK